MALKTICTEKQSAHHFTENHVVVFCNKKRKLCSCPKFLVLSAAYRRRAATPVEWWGEDCTRPISWKSTLVRLPAKRLNIRVNYYDFKYVFFWHWYGTVYFFTNTWSPIVSNALHETLERNKWEWKLQMSKLKEVEKEWIWRLVNGLNNE